MISGAVSAAVRVKICCIESLEDAVTAVRLGADALGLVSEMPSGPGVIDEAEIARIAGAVPPGVCRFLLTSRQDVDAIVEQQRRTGVDTLQIVDRLAPGALLELKRRLPGVRLVQVIHVRGPESVEEAVAASRDADGLLLDSGNPKAAVKELGGTGRTHDWSLSRQIRDAAGLPVYLAGGLTPENVQEAIARVEPFGVDVCSGVRSAGRLDPVKLGQFMRSVAGRPAA